MKTIEAIQKRRSIRHYDPTFKISDEEIKELIELAMLSPTSYNIQHWKFVVVNDPKLRNKIKEAAYGQVQVTEASALILVVTDIKAWEKDMSEKWKNVPKEIGDFMATSAHQFYLNREQLQRDEAIRSASFATQTLTLSATAMGYGSGIMIGFDFDKTSKLINLPENHIISNIVVIGKGIQGANPRGGQMPVENVLIKNRF
ncbi:MAG: nitroreductase family protein [Bacteroidetes bacterium]|nr:nitroreductase family protein [Bacteroidota bacterium]